MPESADIFSYLRMIAGAGAVLVGLYYLLKRGDGELSDDQVDDDNAAAAQSPFKPAPRDSIVPRTLAESPFSATTDTSVLSGEIEIAVTASARLHRTVGLIYFEFPALEAIERDQGRTVADVILTALTDDFRRVLRGTDNVSIIDRNQILVCICLLDSRKDLETIASRLSAGARRRGLIAPDAPSLPVGLAICPLDGDSGEKLIDAARRHYRELTSAFNACYDTRIAV
jgi:hypothetical protein